MSKAPALSKIIGGARAGYQFDLSWAAAKDRLPLESEKASNLAVALCNRLLDVESLRLELRAELGRLHREVDNTASASVTRGGWFEVPPIHHAWPLAEQPGRDTACLNLYDRRVDDPVILQSLQGRAFFSRFGLDSPSPDFIGATAALTEVKPRLRLIHSDSPESPDVSIVIPALGRLSCTLSCLDSLLSHNSRYSAEIIVADDGSLEGSGEFLAKLPATRYHRQPVYSGFISTCNIAGTLARGRYILILRNDTRVVPGWLDALLDTYVLYPRIGLVGSKLFHPDGSLKEAGGIIWRDGSCWQYGRNDDPNRPQYAHARQVDYVSACSMALPLQLWHQLGGFDPLFAPSGCEDVDLCLRVASNKHEVWLQTQSRVVCYQDKRPCDDTPEGNSDRQLVNTRKLFFRWHEALERHRPRGEASYFERDRQKQRRILVIDATTPTPKQDAGSVQTILAMQVCHELGYKIHFVAGHNWLFQPEYTSDLQMRGIECAYVPFDLDLSSYMRLYGHLFDVVLVYRVNVLGPIIEDIRRHAPQAALLFHLADLHYLRLHRQAGIEGNPEALREAEALKEHELALVRAVDCTITHSTVEAEILNDEVPDAPVIVWPLMLECFGTKILFRERKNVCFLGGYQHAPNVDAVKYFVREILPLVRAADPSIRFIIAGANPTQEVIDLRDENIDVVGLVDNLRDLFDRARVFVCPLRIGAGVKGKILSALSYGIPIVSTSIGVEGSGLEKDIHALVADTAEKFAESILRLYNDEAMWENLSIAGQTLVRSGASIDMGRSILNRAIDRGHKHRLHLDAVDVY
jgi:O-antigen biosynthesis protein